MICSRAEHAMEVSDYSCGFILLETSEYILTCYVVPAMFDM